MDECVRARDFVRKPLAHLKKMCYTKFHTIFEEGMRMEARIKDMTKGRPGRLILMFALPLMLGNICQQLYTMVDAAVVGKVVGVQALAAVGATDWLNWMVLGILTGFTQGFSILISHRYGAKDEAGLRRSVALSVLLTAVIAVVLTVASLALLSPVLDLLNTPEDVRGDAVGYITVIFSGITVVAAYNIASCILRALGDSRTPLFAMLIAAAINIVLDILFVAGFGWGVVGAAAATVIAQAFSFLFCLNALRKIALLRLARSDFAWNREMIQELVRLGLPVAFQNTVIAGGGMAVQRVINGFGVNFVAGYTATNKMYGMLELAASSYGAAVSTFSGQNLGANRYGRIRKGVRISFVLATVTSAVIGAVMLIFGRGILSLFISGEAQQVTEVLDVAYAYLSVMSCCLPILYWLWLYRSALQGMGDTVLPMVSGIAELAMRVGAVLVLPSFLGEYGVYVAEVLAWAGAAVVLAIAYYRKIARFPQEDAEDMAPGESA